MRIQPLLWGCCHHETINYKYLQQHMQAAESYHHCVLFPIMFSVCSNATWAVSKLSHFQITFTVEQRVRSVQRLRYSARFSHNVTRTPGFIFVRILGSKIRIEFWRTDLNVLSHHKRWYCKIRKRKALTRTAYCLLSLRLGLGNYVSTIAISNHSRTVRLASYVMSMFERVL